MSSDDFEAERKRQEDQDRLREIRYAEDIKWLMGHESGRRIMYKLFERGGVDRTSFRLNNEMPFLEGHRNLALMFKADIIANDLEEQLFRMMKEAKEPV